MVGKLCLEIFGMLQIVVVMEYVFKGCLVDFDLIVVLQVVMLLFVSMGKGCKCIVVVVFKLVLVCINMDFNVVGVFLFELKFKLGFCIYDSIYDVLFMSGQGDINLVGMCFLFSCVNVQIVGNMLDLDGSFGIVCDKFKFKVDVL